MPALLRAMPASGGLGDLIVTIGLNVRWPDLTERERAAVGDFCRAWFADTLRRPPTSEHTARRVLDAAAGIGLDLDPYLAHWETVDTHESRWQLVDMAITRPDASYAEAFDRWLLGPAARAMIAACDRDELSSQDRDQLEVAAWAIDLREQGKW